MARGGAPGTEIGLGWLCLLVGLIALTPSCAAVPYASPGVAGAAGQGGRPYVVMRVYYGTDRTQTGGADPYDMFGAGRGVLTFGAGVVGIPANHEPGVLESHSPWKIWHRRDDPAHDVTLLSVDLMTKDQFVSELRARIAEVDRKRVLIFIHGYNVSFADSMRRTAQLAYDLDFEGVPVAYSWPSNGELLAYEADAANADWTGRHLHEFLSLVARESGAVEASLIVHSMGNRALAAALNDLAQSPTVGGMSFREIVLAAPDLDRDTFRDQIAPAFQRTDARVTLYASGRDEALKASKRLAAYPRAGDTDGGIVTVPGIESVDASAVDTSLLGHSYFAEERPVLSDIKLVVQGHLGPDQRPTLGPSRLEPLSGGRYWQVKAAQP